MKAIAIEEFGGRDKLRLADVPEPPLLPDGVRIAIRAAGVNPVDWKTREGRQVPRFPHVFPVILGWDAAGVVAEVGPAVTRFAPGDEVWAYCRKHFIGEGTYCEQVVVPQEFVAAKPGSLFWETAAAMPLAALTAWQCLVDRLELAAGETVLVHAAAGGVGHFAVQIADALGARAIGTASAANEQFVRSLGAEFLDYRSGALPEHVDAALDPLGGEMLERTKQIADRVVSIVQPGEGHLYQYVRPDGDQLETLGRLVDEGRLRPHVQEVFPLEDAAAAHELLEAGHVRGKLVLAI
ncbi:MAG TPA: NADP-dependent oxidoreductase [Gaiellaceae bacterium]|nr:NADP-dependent oxidoreductase [Gaiellaceae bacterium]